MRYKNFKNFQVGEDGERDLRSAPVGDRGRGGGM